MIKKNIPFYLYMAESEGCLPIDEKNKVILDKIVNDFIYFAKSGCNIDAKDTQDEIFLKYKVEPTSLTRNEKAYIKASVKKQFEKYKKF